MVAGSATTRGVATLLASSTSAAGTIPLFTKLQGFGADVEEPAAKPHCIEEGSNDRQSDHWEH